MYRTILLPLDGSPLAERAIPYGEALARASGARLILAQAPIAHLAERADPATGNVQTIDLATTYLQAVAARLAGQGIAAETALVYGEASDAVLEAARVRQADLIVMATHGRSGLGRWLYGSVADHVLRHAEVPVLLVPAAGEYTWPLPVSRRPAPPAAPEGGARRPRMLVPLDGSDLAHEALNATSDLATALGADLLLLQVVALPTYPYGEAYAYVAYDPSADLVAAREYLEGVAATLRARGHTVAVQAEVGFAAPTIAEVAREQHADVIAMATHGRSGLARLVLGSVATGTLHQANVPLLLVRPVALRHPAAEATAAARPATAGGGDGDGDPDGERAGNRTRSRGFPAGVALEAAALDALRTAPWPG